jgi:hypothetical protein
MREAVALTQGTSTGSAAASQYSAAASDSSVEAASVSLPPVVRQRRRRLLRALELIQRCWIMDSALEQWLIQHHARAIPINDDAAVKSAALQLSRTMLSHQLSPQAVATLSTAVVELIFTSRGSLAIPLKSVCESLLADCPAVTCSQLPLSDTRSLNGFLIPAAKVALRSMPTSVQGGKMLILHCTLHAAPMAHEAAEAHLTLEAHSAEAAMAFLTAGERTAERWVQRFQKEGVKLLLCTYKLHDATLASLAAAGIAVLQCLDEFDTRRVAHYASIHPVQSLAEFEPRFDGKRDVLPPLPLGEVGAFAQILVGNQMMSHLELNPPVANAASSSRLGVAPLIRPHTLLLCGASDGMCKQYDSMVQRCLRMLQDWFSETALGAATAGVTLPSKQVAKPAAAASAAKPSAGMFGSMKGGFFGAPPARAPAVAPVAATIAVPASSSTSSIPCFFLLGGGCAAELSLLLFCESQARLIPHAQPSSHPLLPAAAMDPASATASASSLPDFAAAFRVLSSGLSQLPRTLLSNGMASWDDATSGEQYGRGAVLQWLKLLPHLVSLPLRDWEVGISVLRY